MRSQKYVDAVVCWNNFKMINVSMKTAFESTLRWIEIFHIGERCVLKNMGLPLAAMEDFKKLNATSYFFHPPLRL